MFSEEEKTIKKMGWDKIKIPSHDLVKALREVKDTQLSLEHNRNNHGV